MLTGLPTPAHLQEIEEHAKNARSILAKTVFVAGPKIDQTKDLSEDLYEHPTAYLRHQICNFLAENQFTVYAGENAELLQRIDAIYKKANNSQISEAYIAENFAAAVIILPDSPGSFAELGAWSGCHIISPKMLVLVSNEYEDDDGYVVTGPVKESKRNNATIFYYDKNDTRKLINFVEEFVDGKIINSNIRGYK